MELAGNLLMNTASDQEHEHIDSLIERIKQGDQGAFMIVISRYQKNVFQMAYSFFYNREDAMDIVQDTFLKLHQKIHLFRPAKEFKSWLLQIAKNLCIDHYRKNYKKRGEFIKNKNIEDMPLPAGKEHDLDSDVEVILSQCLKRLSERQRMVFTMKHFNQLQYKEIAQILNVAVGTVKSLHFKATQNLKVMMTPYLGRQP